MNLSQKNFYSNFHSYPLKKGFNHREIWLKNALTIKSKKLKLKKFQSYSHVHLDMPTTANIDLQKTVDNKEYFKISVDELPEKITA